MSKDERMPRPGDAGEPPKPPQAAGDEPVQSAAPGPGSGPAAPPVATDESVTTAPEPEPPGPPAQGSESAGEPGPADERGAPMPAPERPDPASPASATPSPSSQGPERPTPSGTEPPTPSSPAPSPPGPEPPRAPAVESPSPDVALADEASPLPGAHRGGFRRLPTAPVPVMSQTAPAEPGTEDTPPGAAAQWLMPPTDPPHRGLAAWALASSIAGLVVSLFVGWGFPIGLVGVVSAILALRRPLESRAVAVWALAIGVVSILYSAGWLFYAASIATGSVTVSG